MESHTRKLTTPVEECKVELPLHPPVNEVITIVDSESESSDSASSGSDVDTSSKGESIFKRSQTSCR